MLAAKAVAAATSEATISTHLPVPERHPTAGDVRVKGYEYVAVPYHGHAYMSDTSGVLFHAHAYVDGPCAGRAVPIIEAWDGEQWVRVQV